MVIIAGTAGATVGLYEKCRVVWKGDKCEAGSGEQVQQAPLKADTAGHLFPLSLSVLEPQMQVRPDSSLTPT